MAPLPHLLLARYTYTICLLFCGVLLIFPATNALRPPSSLLPTTAFHTAHYGRTQTGTSKYSIGHTQKIHKYRDRYDELFACEETSALFRVRGGDNRDGQPGAVINIWEKAKNTYTDILPGTRLHLSLILITTAAHLIGLPAPLLFSLPVSLSPSHLLQLWRPFTAVSYLGVPSMSMANNLYFLLKFGQALEASTGSATHVWFLLTQTAMLTALGLLFSSPFQAKALVASVVYSWSRVTPLQPLNFQFGVKISAWHLPFCLALIDCLSRQSAAALWPHVLGILTSHLFHFSRNIAPSLPSSSPSSFSSLLIRLFETPQWLKKRLGDPSSRPGSNVIDFRRSSKVEKEASSDRDIKKRSKKTGHILGSSLPSK